MEHFEEFIATLKGIDALPQPPMPNVQQKTNPDFLREFIGSLEVLDEITKKTTLKDGAEKFSDDIKEIHSMINTIKKELEASKKARHLWTGSQSHPVMKEPRIELKNESSDRSTIYSKWYEVNKYWIEFDRLEMLEWGYV